MTPFNDILCHAGQHGANRALVVATLMVRALGQRRKRLVMEGKICLSFDLSNNSGHRHHEWLKENDERGVTVFVCTD